MLLVTVSIVMLCPLELLHEAEALDVEFADLWVTELALDPAREPEIHQLDGDAEMMTCGIFF